MAGNSSALDTALVRGRSQILNTRITEPEMLDRAFSTYGVTPDGYPSCLLLMMLMGKFWHQEYHSLGFTSGTQQGLV